MKTTSPKQPSNYEIMRDRMELEFVRYDQENMIRKFSLTHDTQYLYLRFFGRDYRINRHTGRVEWFCKTTKRYFHADYSESMIIFDMLAWSKPDCQLDGRFVTADNLRGTVKSASPAAGVFARQADPFEGKAAALCNACMKLGGKPGTVGDVSSTIPLFDFFPVVLQFWDADEEFEAVLKFMWDRNSTDFMHYETICFAMGHMVRRLKEEMEE